MNYTRKILKEYAEKNKLYGDFSVAVQNLLENLLKKNNYKYQISQRIKEIDSLKEKIQRKKRIGKIYRHLGDIEDILGIRVVFFAEEDRKNFIKKLSKALGGTLKIEETSKVSGYRSTHVIISFGPERIHLDEYKRFKGLKCEVQMTPILNHAWAEVEHDIFYKEGSEIQSLDKKKYLSLKGKMELVMNEYIQKASNGMENIIKNIRKLETQKK